MAISQHHRSFLPAVTLALDARAQVSGPEWLGPWVLGSSPRMTKFGDRASMEPMAPLIRPSGTFSHGGEKAKERRD